ncbi:hypothetical protein AAG570_003222 [Ranatra chinensis]|uniref:Kv channel-interacting protein 4 n=1 Tax=Ranatra chinensis TaxID=642074 RepID=A0ABD0Y6L4_9HEMI
MCAAEGDDGGGEEGGQEQQRQNSSQQQQQQPTGQLRRHKHRSLYRRLFGYVKEAWTGVKFALGTLLIVADSEFEDLETPLRYRPDSLETLCKATRFSQAELKRIYRGFKAECPTGLVKEETFKAIYAQFFPQGANTGQYAHYVFNTLDQDHTGILSFEVTIMLTPRYLFCISNNISCS